MPRSHYVPPNLPRSSTEALIDEWVRGNIERQILKDVYFNGLTIDALAEKYGLADSTIKRKLTAAHDQLYRHLSPETTSEN